MRLDDSTSMIHDFNAPYYTHSDYWALDLQQQYPSTYVPARPQQKSASTTPTAKSVSRQDKASSEKDEIPMCRWNDEVTGYVSLAFLLLTNG